MKTSEKTVRTVKGANRLNYWKEIVIPFIKRIIKKVTGE